jgi:hypothetical protein
VTNHSINVLPGLADFSAERIAELTPRGMGDSKHTSHLGYHRAGQAAAPKPKGQEDSAQGFNQVETLG